MEKEIWKPIKGFENDYEASNLGRIRSIEKYGIGIGKGAYRKGVILKGDVSNYGKLRYTLCNCKKYMGHILVAKSFPEICGEWFEGCDVHHKDGNPSNNRADNLICLTKEEHHRIHRELGKFDGQNNPFYGKHHTEEAKFKNAEKHRKPINQYSIDGVFIKRWPSVTDCERDTGMLKASINKCCLGKQHTAYGFKWSYAA